MPDEWADEWDDDADDSDSDPLPPAYYNADAELARELDISKVWEPAALKVTETPFTIANRQRRVSEANGGGGARARGKSTSTLATHQVIGRPGDHQSTGGPSRSTTTSKAKKNDPPPPPPPARRRGPVPAKSGKLFGVDPPEEKKEAVKKATKKWTKAEVDGWKDANGNPIPSTKPAGKKGAAAKPKKSILDLLEESAEKTKGGKGGKGKGKKEAQVVVPAVGAGVELPDEPEAPVKKKRAPAKKKKEVEEGETKAAKKKAPVKKKQVQKADEVDELESEEEAVVVVKKGKAPAKKKGQQKEEEVDELESEEEEQVVVVKKGKVPAKKKKVEVMEVLDDEEEQAGESDDEPDSLVEEIMSRKRAKEREAGKEDEDGPPAKKGKAATKAKGKGKAKEGDSEIRFTRLPAGAEASDEYPIVKLLERQKTLPTKPKPKPKPKATKATKKSKPAVPQSSSSQIDDMSALAFINSLAGRKDDSSESAIPIEQLFPALQTSHLLKRKKRDSEGGESVDPDESEDEDERVHIGSGSQDDEEEGKKGLMSRYFALAGAGEEGDDGRPTQTAPTTLDSESLPPDSSSALPHSSPTERRALRRQDSNLVHPQPVRNIPLPNADKFDHLAKLAERSRREAEGKKDKIRRKEPDVTTFMRKGMTIAQPPMSTNRLHRPRSPQSQIDSRFREPTLQPVKPDARNTDMFRSPAYKGRSAINLAEPSDEKPEVWGTLGQTQKKTIRTTYTPYDYNPHASHSSRDDMDSSSANTISQLAKRPMFTPQAPKITIPIPKFTTKTSAGTGAYGSAASTTAEEPVLDPYQRAIEQEAAGAGEYRRNGIGQPTGGYASAAFQGDSPEVETLRGRQGTVYTIHKEKSGRYKERPRYMPATAVTLVPGDRANVQRDSGDWMDGWKFQSKTDQGLAPGAESYRPSYSVAIRGDMADGRMDGREQATSDWRLPAKAVGRFELPAVRTSSSNYDHTTSSFDPRLPVRSRSRLSGRAGGDQRRYSPADPFRPSSRNLDVSYPHLPQVPFNRASSSQHGQAYPVQSSYPPEHPAQHPRPSSRDTGRAGNSLLARIPIATFNGSKPRPSSTVYPDAGRARPHLRQEGRGGVGRMAEVGSWRGMPEAGPSNYAALGYGNGAQADTGYEGYGGEGRQRGEGYTSAGQMQWYGESI